jgi:hypothetical protein
LAPSTIWPHVTYVDKDKRAAKFFSDRDLMLSQLNTREYTEEPEPVFIHQDFNQPITALSKKFDLIISLFSGPSIDIAIP